MVTREDIDRIVEMLAGDFKAEKIILFGSFARGEETEQSDIDLLVVAPTQLAPHERYPAVRRLLHDFPAAFDIVVKTPEEYRRWRSVVNHVVYFADKYGRVIYER